MTTWESSQKSSHLQNGAPHRSVWTFMFWKIKKKRTNIAGINPFDGCHSSEQVFIYKWRQRFCEKMPESSHLFLGRVKNPSKNSLVSVKIKKTKHKKTKNSLIKTQHSPASKCGLSLIVHSWEGLKCSFTVDSLECCLAISEGISAIIFSLCEYAVKTDAKANSNSDFSYDLL